MRQFLAKVKYVRVEEQMRRENFEPLQDLVSCFVSDFAPQARDVAGVFHPTVQGSLT